MSATLATSHRFGRIEVRPVERQVLVDGRAASLGARAFDVLLALIRHRDRLLSKNELLDLVWPNLVVEENNLQVHVSALRKLLGPATIATVPGRGYRFAAVLADDPVAAVPPAAPVDVAPFTPAGNLPAALPALVGRSADLAGVGALVQEHRLITLAGAGGLGKTRLAQAVAQRLLDHFADGAWIVELAAITDPAGVPAAVAQALRIALPGRAPAQEELVDRLRKESLLLVLDNCEHVADSVAALIQPLLEAAPGLHILATSQQRLKVGGEHVVRLNTLAVPEGASLAEAAEHGAVALFVERVAALQSGFVLDEHNVAAVVDICRHLDGVPLALELAAARVPLLGVEGVREHLAERFRMLTGGARVAVARHRTLHAALDWSHALLNPEEQKVFRRLGVFVGGFGLELAQQVACDDTIDPWAVLDHLGALIDKSMVVSQAGEPPRYRLLETARDYARERLAAAGETVLLQRRHAHSVHAMLDRHATPALLGRASMDDLVRACAPEIDNLRAAIEWASGPAGDTRLAIGLVNDAAVLLYQVGRYPECARWMLALETRVDDTTPALAAGRFRFGLGLVGMHGLPAARRQAMLVLARQNFEVLGERELLGHTLALMIYVAIVRKDFVAAELLLGECGAVFGAEPPPLFLHALILYIRGLTCRYSERHDEALRAFSEALPLAREVGDPRLVYHALMSLAALHLEIGHVDEAVKQHRVLVELSRSSAITDNQMRAFTLAWLAQALTVQGALDEAQALMQEAVPFMRRSVGVLHFSGALAGLAARQGRLPDAARLIGADDAAHRRRGEARTAAAERSLAATLAMVVAEHPQVHADAWRLEGEALSEDAAAELAFAGGAATNR